MRVDGEEEHGDRTGGGQVAGTGAGFGVAEPGAVVPGSGRRFMGDQSGADPLDERDVAEFDRAERERTEVERITSQRSARDRATRAARLEVEMRRLAGLAAGGDRAALERFLELIRPPVVRYCRARLGTGGGVTTPEDVAQDVLLAVCGALPRYRPGDTAAMAFVYGIARNKVVDAFRSAGRDRSEPTDLIPDSADDGPGPDVEAVLATEIVELRGLLDLLSESQREVLVLRIALGFTAEETATAVGSTPGAVRVTQHRALTKLRALAAGRRTDER